MINEMKFSYTWWTDTLILFFRYFLLAGIAYFIFYVWKQKKYSKIKIQNKIPTRYRISNEILFSMITISIYGCVSGLVFKAEKMGITKIYFDIKNYGYLYLIISIVLMIFIHDAYFYWTHRFMHIPGIFKRIQKTHHLSDNPTPWSAFSFHPLEAILSAGIVPFLIFLFPLSF